MIFIGIQNTMNAQLKVLSGFDSSAIAQVKVTLATSGIHCISDANGYVKIPDFNRPLKVDISKHGFDTLLNITIMPGDVVYLKPYYAYYEAVVYTGNFGDKKTLKDEIAHVKIIGLNEIRATSSQNLGDILKYQPNITLTQDPALGTAISINGMSGQNVKLLKNGSNISGAMNGSIDVSQINLNNIAQIEIIEGPMSLLYGSNALAGTVNIISKIPGVKTSAFAKSYTESSGIYNFSAGFGSKIKSIRYNLSGGRNFFDGWNPGNSFFYYPANSIADVNRSTLWKPRQQIFGDLGLFVPLAKFGNARINHDFLLENIISKGAPQKPYNETAFDDYFTTIRNTNSIEWNLINQSVSHNVLASYSYFKRTKNTFFKDLTIQNIGTLTGPDDQDTTVILTSQVRYINSAQLKSIKLNSGIDFNHETFDGKRVQGSGKSIYNISFVGIASYTYKKLLDLKVGIRQTLHSRNKIPIIPSFSAKLKLNAYTDLKLTAARAYRTPGIKELYLYFVDINHNIVGNPNLLSESSDNFNLILSRNRKHGKNSLFHWQVNAYHNQFKNLITLAAINTIEYTYVNIGKSIVRGLNSELGVDFGRFEFQYRNAVISSSNNLGVNGIPDYFTTINHNFNGTFKLIPKKNVRINAFINRFGKTPSVNYDNNQAILVHTDAYWMIDFSALMPFKIKSSLLNLTCGMRNLANVSNIRTGLSNGIAHQSSTGQRIISTGRTLFFGLEFIL